MPKQEAQSRHGLNAEYCNSHLQRSCHVDDILKALSLFTEKVRDIDATQSGYSLRCGRLLCLDKEKTSFETGFMAGKQGLEDRGAFPNQRIEPRIVDDGQL